jgi:hypothetical protein
VMHSYSARRSCNGTLYNQQSEWRSFMGRFGCTT